MVRLLIALALSAAAALAQTPSIKATLGNPAFRRVMACGHRGAPLHAPENTIPSFQHAVGMGADIIELDARYTRDGQWVVFHDSSVDRLTGQKGAIEQMTLEEVKSLRINLSRFADHRDLRILTLKEALEFLKERAITYIDHKTGPAYLLAKEVQRLGATDRAFIVSRTPQWAAELRRAGADIHIMGAINDGEPESLIAQFLESRLTLMELPLRYLTPANIQLVRKAGARIFTNSLGAEELQRFDAFQALLYRGADVIQTDHLDWLVPYLRMIHKVQSRFIGPEASAYAASQSYGAQGFSQSGHLKPLTRSEAHPRKILPPHDIC